MKKQTLLISLLLLCLVVRAQPPSVLKLSDYDLLDKIKGGWAGQTIGVVFGAPTEFKFSGTYIQDYQPISWDKGYVKYWWDKKPGLFDDIYNDITFVEAFQELGLDCSQLELAKRFAYADYHLAHANQAGRYNIRQGILPPESGHWRNNPHADDLDFQIEADFIGLMAPGMLPQAMEIASRVGHIMNSGDGFYGGAFVAALYSTAFCETDPKVIVEKALSVIPAESTFFQCINDVIRFHALHPQNWKDCWYFLQEKWNCDVGCPKGVFLNFNIDAKLNSAFVALALLYGEGDYTRSLDIATRCGQDSDCNPSTVGGVLGVMYGYSQIPGFWLEPLKEIEDLDFEGTTTSLSKAYNMSFGQAKQMIVKAGGKVTDSEVEIPLYTPEVLPLEQNFENTFPLYRERKDCFLTDTYAFDFNGNGFVIWGNLCCTRHISFDYIDRVSTRHIGSEVFGLAEPDDPYVAIVEVWIDQKLDHVARLPMRNADRRLEPAWKYLLNEGRHHVALKWLNPEKDYVIRINDIVYYSENRNHDKFYINN
ncbi:MAG: ADP-ribosylglycohydrolase family protein [Bacteroides sp.]|nr:ADP-ribosylglycohydrolase family protein [Bacteroides sp.]